MPSQPKSGSTKRSRSLTNESVDDDDGSYNAKRRRSSKGDRRDAAKGGAEADPELKSEGKRAASTLSRRNSEKAPSSASSAVSVPAHSADIKLISAKQYAELMQMFNSRIDDVMSGLANKADKEEVEKKADKEEVFSVLEEKADKKSTRKAIKKVESTLSTHAHIVDALEMKVSAHELVMKNIGRLLKKLFIALGKAESEQKTKQKFLDALSARSIEDFFSFAIVVLVSLNRAGHRNLLSNAFNVWYRKPGNKESVKKFIDSKQNKLAWQGSAAPECATAEALREAISDAEHDLPDFFMKILGQIEVAVAAAVKATADENMTFELAQSDEELRKGRRFPQIQDINALTPDKWPLALYVHAVALDQWATKAEQHQGGPLSRSFSNPFTVWPARSSERTDMEQIGIVSVQTYNALLQIMLPLFHNPVAIFQLRFWRALREFANGVAHSVTRIPRELKYLEDITTNWFPQAGREAYRTVAELKAVHNELKVEFDRHESNPMRRS